MGEFDMHRWLLHQAGGKKEEQPFESLEIIEDAPIRGS
jgi:hypothetical protein